MSKWSPLLRLLILVAAVGAVVACLPQPGVPGAPGTGGPPTARRGEFRIVQPSEPRQWDPNRSNLAQEIAVSSLMFEGLLGYDKDLKLVPHLAREVPSRQNGGISADGRTYTYRLRDNVVWSDGQPVTAQNFEYSLKRTLNPDTAATYATSYYGIVGAREYHTARGTQAGPQTPSAAELRRLRDAVAVRAVDAKTLEIKLNEPIPSFNQRMALWPAYPNRQDLIEQFGDRWLLPAHGVVTGPWKLAEYVEKDRMVFVANDRYWGEKPRLERLIYRFIPDEHTAYAAFEAGEVDFVAVPTQSRRAFMNDPAKRSNLVFSKELVIFGFQMNNTKPPFDNVKVRQAFSQALDRVAFVETIEQGVGQPSDSLIPEGMPGYDRAMGQVNRFDPIGARRLLAEAGFPDGRGLPEIKLSYADTAGNKLRAEYLQAEFKKHLGVEIKLNPLESRAFTSFYTGNQHQAAFSGWSADYADPDNFISELFGRGSGNNHSLITGDDQLEQMIQAARAEPDSNKRLELWKQAQRRVHELAPWAFTHYRNRLWIIKPNFQGLQTTAKDQLPGNRFYHLVSVK